MNNKLADFPLAGVGLDEAPDEMVILGFGDWYLTVGDVRAASKMQRAPVSTPECALTKRLTQAEKERGELLVALQQVVTGWEQGSDIVGTIHKAKALLDGHTHAAANTEALLVAEKALRVKLSCIFAAGVAHMDPTEDYDRVIAHVAGSARIDSPPAADAVGVPPLGVCCYGGPLKPKSACASCAAWQPRAPAAEEDAGGHTIDHDAFWVLVTLLGRAKPGPEYRQRSAELVAYVDGWVNRAPASAAALYTCKGKGGEYALMGVVYGAGRSRGQMVNLYRETATGVMYFRMPDDFADRMEPLRPAAEGAARLKGD